MAKEISNKLMEAFQKSIIEIEPSLSMLSFTKTEEEHVGLRNYVKFKKGATKIEFLFGAPEFQIEFVLHTKGRKFEWKDLLEISDIASWVNSHRYVQNNSRNLTQELLWFVELLKFSLATLKAI